MKTIALTKTTRDGRQAYVSFAMTSVETEALRDDVALLVEIFDRETDDVPVPVSIKLPRNVLKGMLKQLEQMT